ncbi:flavin-containing monooxygenase [Streptomonospora wellingtoniae]|uniref:NAD(P)-binding domain-containing protein n=1 Tax=Streptomonospora wellingtoniae TaxID=3075544 RepID=A0ABU2KN66_9ACTN|nr:NAD(P)-binding domain-containing protein [Streptomonospora sp. DSM 45055]MDT0300643.1 NAD(P)-binding domain-containing protein [Streptomonospora sp. DSM 45055]
MSTPDDTVIIVGGGQSGLAAARAARDAGLRPLVLEAGERPVGSWPHYYDSLTLFSPARHSAIPGAPFPGDPDRYPHRDEVAAYLERYAAGLDVEIRTNTSVEAVEADGSGFAVRTADGRTLAAAGVVAAGGSFTSPHVPELPGQEDFSGELLHVADYRNPKPYAGKRVVVVGGGNSAVQVAYELSPEASVTLATRAPVRFLQQRHNGRDLHDWLVDTGFDRLPPEWLIHYVGGTLVMETGDYENALNSGRMDRREMFTAFDGDGVVWADGAREPVDAVVFATGYRPALDYLRPLGALNAAGAPLHTGGISATHPGLAYAGLEFQRSFSSNTLRGVHRDAEHVIAPLAAHVRKAPAAAGL